MVVSWVWDHDSLHHYLIELSWVIYSMLCLCQALWEQFTWEATYVWHLPYGEREREIYQWCHSKIYDRDILRGAQVRAGGMGEIEQGGYCGTLTLSWLEQWVKKPDGWRQVGKRPTSPSDLCPFWFCHCRLHFILLSLCIRNSEIFS